MAVFEERLYAPTPLRSADALAAGLRPEDRQQFLEVVSRSETSVDIGRSTTELFAYLTAFSRQPEWMHTSLSVKPESAGGATANAQYLAQELQDLRWDKLPLSTIEGRTGMPYQTRLSITELETDARIAWTAASTPELFSGNWLIRLEPIIPTITTVRLSFRLTTDEACQAALMAALLRWAYPLDVLQRQVDRALHNLRTILEGRAVAPTSS